MSDARFGISLLLVFMAGSIAIDGESGWGWFLFAAVLVAK